MPNQWLVSAPSPQGDTQYSGLTDDHRVINKQMLALEKQVWQEKTRLTSSEVLAAAYSKAWRHYDWAYVWINLGFWETAHLHLPKLNVNICVSLGGNVGLGEGSLSFPSLIKKKTKDGSPRRTIKQETSRTHTHCYASFKKGIPNRVLQSRNPKPKFRAIP